MTFYEAAVEVLRRSGRPLHYKKITEIAVREELLSHVGKTPHLTMNDRLEKEIQKNEASAIDQERPGVFKLDEEHAEEVTARIERKRKEERKRKRERQQQSRRDRQDHSEQQKKQHRQGNRDESTQNEQKNDRDDRSGGGEPKRRRSRGSKSDQQPQTRKKRRSRGSDDGSQDDSDSGDRDQGNKRRRRRRDGDEDEPEDSRTVSTDVSGVEHLEQGPVRLKGIPRAAREVLRESDRSLAIDELADRIFDETSVKFHTHSPVATVKSALANDNQIRQRRGHRKLFESDDADNWRLTEWDLESRVHQKEQAALSLAEEIRQDTKQQLGRALTAVQAEAFEHLALTLLERLGYHNIKVSKRSSEGDVFFTADWRQGLSDVRVCVRVVTDHDRTLQRDAVEDLRETLDHYSASEGVIIHLGSVDDGAVEKGRIEGEAPITLLDEDTFVELLMKHGIGVTVYDNPIVTVDSEFVDALAD